MQLCFRGEPPQIVPPAVIFHGKPFIDDDDNIDPRTPARTRARERKQYDPRVIVYWDPKAYASCPVSDAWLEDFDKITKTKNPKRALGLDNYSTQSSERYQAEAKEWNIKLVFTPEDCTDVTAVTDDGIGNEIKKRIVKMYQGDLESSEERLAQWKDGKVSASERRILFTKWLGDAWEDFTTNNQKMITNAFKRCGMYNDIDGKENHLVKLDKRMPNYAPPAKDAPRSVVKKTKKRKRKNKATGSKAKKKQKRN